MNSIMNWYRSSMNNMITARMRPPHIFECAVQTISREVGPAEFIRSMMTTNTNLQYALQTIREAYSDSNLRRSVSTNLNYNLPQLRAAYLYAYGTSHIHMIYNEWNLFLDLVPDVFADMMTKAKFNDYHNIPLEICCIGGGPATDAIALQLFLNDKMNFSGSMAVSVLDKWVNWALSANELVTQVNNNLPRCRITEPYYYGFDFFNDDPFEYLMLRNADIISISKFISVVSQDRTLCHQKLVQIFNAIKPDAIVFFYENSGGGYYNLFNRAACEAGLFMLAQHPRHTTVVCQTEQSVMLHLAGQYQHQSRHPQRRASVTSSLWIKRQPRQNVHSTRRRERRHMRRFSPISRNNNPGFRR